MLLLAMAIIGLAGCRTEDESRAHTMISQSIERSEAMLSGLKAHPGDLKSVQRAFGVIRQSQPDAILEYRRDQKACWEVLEPRDRAHFLERIEILAESVKEAMSSFTEEEKAAITQAIATIN